MEYTFRCYGHPNIRATHPKTIEFTKDLEITERGDCIVGVKSDFDLGELKKLEGRVYVICSVIDPESGEDIVSQFKCKVNPAFNSDHEVVLRKSGFNSERTFGFGLSRGANHLDRRIVELLQSEDTVMQVMIKDKDNAGNER